MTEKKPINWRDYFEPDFVSDDDSFVFGRGTNGAGQQMMLEARGWGYLNGQRCGLSAEDTIEVQRQILEVAVNALKEAWAGETAVERLTKERDDLQVVFDAACREKVFCEIHMGRNADLYTAEKEKVRVLKAALKAEDDIQREYESESLKGIDLIIRRLKINEQRHDALKFCERSKKI